MKPSFQILVGDVLYWLRQLPDRMFQVCATSPPYWGLRDYGTGNWQGGDPSCVHDRGGAAQVPQTKHQTAAPTIAAGGNRGAGRYCVKCGAEKIDFQIGTEPTPEEYVAKLVEVFREVRRVLRDDGVAWINLGDCYAGSAGSSDRRRKDASGVERPRVNLLCDRCGREFEGTNRRRFCSAFCGGSDNTPRDEREEGYGLKAKDLVGIPWRVALALQQDGWYLRSDCIWAKGTSHQKALKETAAEAMLAHGASPEWVEHVLADWEPYVGNCMPSSVEDRPTSGHEYVFLLSKSKTYFYDADAVREESVDPFAKQERRQSGLAFHDEQENLHESKRRLVPIGRTCGVPAGGRNMRSVWTIPPQPFPGAHFATFPPKLVEPMIRAGSSEEGACAACGAPWERVVTRGAPAEEQRSACGADASGSYSGTSTKDHAAVGVQDASAVKARILAGMRVRASSWRPSCECAWPGEPARTPCLVLDPFSGSGTTGAVALAEGRSFVGIELNPEYAAMAERRISEPDFAKKVRREQREAKEKRIAEFAELKQRFHAALADASQFTPTGIPKIDAYMLILAHLRRAGPAGLTCDEVEVALGAVHQSVSARVSELKGAGAIRESGEKRETRTGARARVLVLDAAWGGAG